MKNERKNRASIDALQLIIMHESERPDYRDIDADLIKRCVDMIIKLEGVEPDPEAAERGLQKLLELMQNREMPQDAI